MANIKSQKKRIQIAKAENLQNKSKKSRIATEVRNFRGLIENKKFFTSENLPILIKSNSIFLFELYNIVQIRFKCLCTFVIIVL